MQDTFFTKLKKLFPGATLLVFILLIISCNEKKQAVLKSPDSAYTFKLNINKASGLIYSVSYKKQAVIRPSKLGFIESGAVNNAKELKIGQITYSTVDTSWKPVYGERENYNDKYNKVVVQFINSNNGEIVYNLIVRAYNEGIAFQYEFLQNKEIAIISELTEFNLPDTAKLWVTPKACGTIYQCSVNEFKGLCERPLLGEISKSLYVSIGEASINDFARMKFKKDTIGPGPIITAVEGKMTFKKGFCSPWRYIMVGETPGQVLENNFLILNLNKPNVLTDNSWIKPGKVLRDVTLTSQGGKACVDFAREHNMQFVELDAGWYGNINDDDERITLSDFNSIHPYGRLNLRELTEYASKNDIGVILYLNRRVLEKQYDEILPMMSDLGIVGLKISAISCGSQRWNRELFEVVRKASEYKLMVNIHDDYRPTGLSRTYPNLMTQEGIRGDEESTTNEMVINSIFTRSIAGAADQTNCYFADRVEKMGSHASQLAKSVCIYSPWQFLFWYDRPANSPQSQKLDNGSTYPITEVPELSFFGRIPTVWDDTKVLGGSPDEYASIARKKGEEWFVGVLNGNTNRSIDFKFDFLDKNKEYIAEIYSDDNSLKTRTNVRIEKIDINSSSVFSKELLKRNGLAIAIAPKLLADRTGR